jgi:hypothetical protein
MKEKPLPISLKETNPPRSLISKARKMPHIHAPQIIPANGTQETSTKMIKQKMMKRKY